MDTSVRQGDANLTHKEVFRVSRCFDARCYTGGLPPAKGNPNRPIGDLGEFDFRTVAASDSIALCGPGQQSFSFQQCMAIAAEIARELQEAGIESGDVVALAIPDAAHLLLGLLGVWGVAAAAPLDSRLSETELEARLLLLRPRALATESHPDPKLVAAATRLDVPVLRLRFATVSHENPDAAMEGPAPCVEGSGRSVPDDVAAVLQTSATTGAPKLAPLTHRNLAAMIRNVQRAFDLRATDRCLCLMPLYHLGGLLSALAQLYRGGTVICGSDFSPGNFVDLLESYRPTWYLAGPAMHRSILRVVQERPHGIQQNSLRFIRSGSAPISPDLIRGLEKSLGAPVIHGYGLTEAGVVTSTPLRGNEDVRFNGSVGRSIGVEIAIMSAHGEILEADGEGEIALRGDAVITGYLDNPDADRGAFQNGWFRTGDVGRLDTFGELFVTGRRREMINRGGEKVLPHEIDAVLSEHPLVEHAAAFAIGHPTLGEDIAAAVVPRREGTVDESELLQYVGARIARSKVPSRILFVEKIPVSDTGKPRRQQLTRDFDQASKIALPGKVTGPDAAADPMAHSIARIWLRVLGLARLPDPEENFFALGGDSLAMTRMLAMLESETRVAVHPPNPLRFLANPTIAGLREALLESSSGNSHMIDATVLEGGAAGRPSFVCLPGAALDASYLRPLARLTGEPFIVLRDTAWYANGHPREFEELVNRLVDYLRTEQRLPLGAIGGHCFGGILAFECARRLEALGFHVPCVVLFDTAAPGEPKPLRWWGRYLKWVPRLVQYRESRARLNGRQGLYAGVATFTEAAAAQMRSYVPRPFGGRVVSFVAGERPVSSRVLEDARLGWRDFAIRGFESHVVPGGHDTMFSEQHVPQMARLLRGVLARDQKPDLV
jgi:acyl-CoA synthetase (AMP-forming)/AMP-acid ligase II/thioesterase domain-containing protein